MTKLSRFAAARRRLAPLAVLLATVAAPIAAIPPIAAISATAAIAITAIATAASPSESPHALVALRAPVAVEFDDRGIPTILAEDELDAYRVQGFLHARDRFLQMDLYRRSAAGELAALVGSGVLEMDLAMRPRGLRQVADSIAAALPRRERAIIAAYADGVNEGLRLLRPSPEYTLLGGTREPWRVEDSVLAYLTLFLRLTDVSDRELAWGVWRSRMPEALFEFLLDPVSRFDTPIIGEAPPQQRPIPGPEMIDLRRFGAAPPIDLPLAGALRDDPPDALGALRGMVGAGEIDVAPVLGSNAFVVAGSRTLDGRAILASDPHLMLAMPNIWHRIRLRWPGIDLVGASLPGMPGVIFGSNGHVAWGFTNLTGDFEDWIIVETDPEDPTLYLTPDGLEPFGERIEAVAVRGGGDRELVLRSTRWGPVIRSDEQGRPLVWRSTLQSPESVNIDLLALANARDLDTALGTLARWNGPPQNALVADREGRIGWTITGYLPDREGRDGRTPYSLAGGGEAWTRSLPEALRPIVTDPPEGFIVSANHRPLPLDWAALLGGHWAEPVRARRIVDLLAPAEALDEAALLAVQLDTAVATLEPWRRIVLDSIEPSASGARGALRGVAEAWSGRADLGERAPVALERLRAAVTRDLLDAVLAHLAARDERRPSVGFPMPSDEPWLRIIAEAPPHLLPPRESTWQGFLRRHVDAVAAMEDLAFAELAARHAANPSAGVLRGGSGDGADAPIEALEAPGDDRAALRRAWARRLAAVAAPPPVGLLWGEVNRLQMRHPISIAVPMLARGYDLEHPQAGHRHAVRVATPRFGASLRMVVSPGQESEGFLLSPGGQSGDPTSPHYRSLHDSWRSGTPDPLLPNGPAERMLFMPGG